MELGMRNTLSLFGDAGYTGFGVGGHFRIKLGNRLNTEWFADYIKTDIGGLGMRTDGHIGWSVMYYPFCNNTTKGHFTPYILAGHCFDYTQVKQYGLYYTSSPQERWSSAVHAGLGAHYWLSDRFNLSLAGQYMIHLGKDINTNVNTYNGKEEISIQKGEVGLEGHLLVSLSVNVLVGKLWK